ncbi:MAG TPA: cytochrome D1 domain-containing protein [Vicinamibacterales bacterium]|nr:cytochrome D1 domain-containing protein [Vicinamibacterales bacterium]
MATRSCLCLFVCLLTAVGARAADTPSAALLVLDKSDNSLVIVDAARLQPVARVPAGEDPHEVVVSDDGRLAYISNYGAYGRPSPLHTISVVDLVTQKALPPIDLGALTAPHGLAVAGGRIYFTAEGSKSVGSYDPASRRIDWVLRTGQDGTHMIELSADRSRIFTTNVGSASVSIIERAPVAADSHVSNVGVGRGAEGFDISPDGRELWVANAQDQTVSIVDVAAKKVASTIAVAAVRTNRLKFTRDGKLVFLSDPAGTDVVIVDAATRKEVKKIAVGRGGGGILMTPDGLRAFVALGAENAVAVIDLRTLAVSGRIATGRNPDGLAWAVRK